MSRRQQRRFALTQRDLGVQLCLQWHAYEVDMAAKGALLLQCTCWLWEPVQWPWRRLSCCQGRSGLRPANCVPCQPGQASRPHVAPGTTGELSKHSQWASEHMWADALLRTSETGSVCSRLSQL